MDKLLIAKRLLRLAKVLTGASQGMFKDKINEVKERAKKLKQEGSKKAVAEMEQILRKDLASKGFQAEVSLKLSKFRGSPFVTSGIILISKPVFTDVNDKMILKLLSYLQEKYSPKYRFKGIDNGITKFNIR